MDRYEIEPGQTWELDFFRPEDALGVVQLFRDVYGDGYPVKTFTDPETLIRENQAHRTISIVARTPKGDIVGHVAVFQSAPFKRLYESGSGAAHKDYRGGHGLGAALVRAGLEMAAGKFGVQAVFGEAVCNHVFMQKISHALNYPFYALAVDLMPAEAYTREKSAAGRVAALMGMRAAIPHPHTVYLPKRYDETLRFLYADLDDTREFLVSDCKIPAETHTDLQPQIFDFAQVCRVNVNNTGGDFLKTLVEVEEGAKKQGVVVFQLWLNLNWPWVGEIVDQLWEHGYFLGGILPRWYNEDGLLMQKILVRPNFEGIKLLPLERTMKIFEIVKADWEKRGA